MDLVSRAQAIILKPKEEWVKIKGEPAPVTQLFTSYAAVLALIPAIAQFIGYALIGTRVLTFGVIRMNIGSALLRMVLYYIFALASVYVFGLVINALAPSFGSKQNAENAMKLAVYSMTPAWVGGIFYAIPALWILATLASLYGIYILYLGFATPMMDTAKDKVVGYLVVSFIVMIVLTVVVGLILSALFVVGSVSGL
ncbi:MAG: YIP1 family protein [Candidatus Aminicenantes bacterium]|jgi:hypothetical protein|nr:YIP1 family protein [Candidatus Aminicenantes bacterium]